MQINRATAAVLCVGLLALIGGVVIFQTNAQSNGMIHGCYKQNNGQLRVVPSSSQCHPSENEIAWQSASDSTFDEHHRTLTLSAPANQTVSFQVPKSDVPIHFDLAVSRITYSILPPFDPSTINLPVTMITGQMYYDSEVDEFRLLPIAQGGTVSGQNTGVTPIQYNLVDSVNSNYPNFDVLRFSHDHIVIQLSHVSNTVILETQALQPWISVQTPQITYKMNMWY